MLLCVNNCMKTGKVYRNLAVVEQKNYSYLTRFKNVAFHANFLRTTTKGLLPGWLPQGPHHPRSTPGKGPTHENGHHTICMVLHNIII